MKITLYCLTLATLVSLHVCSEQESPLSVLGNGPKNKRNGKFLFFNKGSDEDKTTSDDLMQMQIYYLQSQLEGLQHDSDAKCDKETCHHLEDELDDLNKKIDNQDDIIYGLLQEINNLKHLMDPCGIYTGSGGTSDYGRSSHHSGSGGHKRRNKHIGRETPSQRENLEEDFTLSDKQERENNVNIDDLLDSNILNENFAKMFVKAANISENSTEIENRLAEILVSFLSDPGDINKHLIPVESETDDNKELRKAWNEVIKKIYNDAVGSTKDVKSGKLGSFGEPGSGTRNFSEPGGNGFIGSTKTGDSNGFSTGSDFNPSTQTGGGHSPHYGDYKPPRAGDRPPPNGDKPRPVGVRPPLVGDKPPATGDKPVGGVRPPLVGDKPPAAGDKPADGVIRSLGGDTLPTSDDKHTPGNGRPPAGGYQPPYGGYIPPYGGYSPPYGGDDNVIYIPIPIPYPLPQPEQEDDHHHHHPSTGGDIPGHCVSPIARGACNCH